MTYGKTSRKRLQNNTPPNDTIQHSNNSIENPQIPAKSQIQTSFITQSQAASSLKGAEENNAILRQYGPRTGNPGDGKPAKHYVTATSGTVSPSRGSKAQEHASKLHQDSNPKPAVSTGDYMNQRRAANASHAPTVTIAPLSPASNTKQTDTDASQSTYFQRTEGQKRSLSPAKPRRRRLIDTLAAQKTASPEPDLNLKQNDDLSEPSQSDLSFTPSSQRPVTDRDTRLRQDHRSRDTPKRRKVKYTYSQSRSFIGESQISGVGLDTGESDPLLLESLLSETSKAPSPDAFDFTDDLEEDVVSRTVIKSAHELRRAGAHNRFADEMEDLLFRIGSPNCDALTMRRNALLELATKLERAEFIDQFRNHAARDKIAQDIGAEKDLVCAVALAAILIIFLSSGPAPHLLRQLAEDHVGRFLCRILHVQEELKHLASQRTTNLPKSSRSALGHVEKLLVNMPIWHGYSITALSPQILALQLLEIFFRVSDAQHLEMVAGVLEPELLLLAERHAQLYSEDHVAIALIVSIFEAQSSATSVLSEKPTNVLRLSPLVTKLFPRILSGWPQSGSELESSTLKLAINITNTESGAAAFNNAAILAGLIKCIDKGFSALQDRTGGSRLPKEAYDGLLLILGVMINVMEHCLPARQSIDDDSMKTLTSLYLTNRRFMDEVRHLLLAQREPYIANLPLGRDRGEIPNDNSTRLFECSTWLFGLGCAFRHLLERQNSD
jgi:hypothetical protein